MTLTVVAATAAIVLGSCSGDGREDSNPSPPDAPEATVTAPDVNPPTGPGLCAFVSIEDVIKATATPRVELRQMMGPNGNPGCEWEPGDDRRALQLEFQLGPAPAGLPPGEDVPGPWQAARWDASSRTLHVDANGQVLFVRASEDDPGRAKDVSIAVATLVAQRN
jgi:hypothetical protein